VHVHQEYRSFQDPNAILIMSQLTYGYYTKWSMGEMDFGQNGNKVKWL
jgi:hypothetical protein